MYIQKIEIYGYGKWVDKVFHLEPGLNLFIGGNEAGKTTLVSFIHSILFGFPTKQSSENRYEPKDSSRYGGKIWIQDSRYGLVGIERVAGKATGDVAVYTEDGHLQADSFLETLLFKIKKDWYQSVFSFDLDGLTDIKQMNKEKLDRYFLSAGTLGSEKFLKEADRLEAEAAKLYKPMGRVPILNRLLKEYETATSKLAASKEKNAQYTHLLNERIDLREKENEEKREKEARVEYLRMLHEMVKNWPQIQEIKHLEKTLKDLPDTVLPEDALYTFDALSEEADMIQSQIYQLKETLLDTQNMLHVSPSFIEYQDQKEKMMQAEKELDRVLEDIHALSFIQVKKESAKQKENEERIKWHFSPLETVPDAYSSDEENELSEYAESFKDIEAELHRVEEERSFLSYKKRSLEEEVDRLEEKIASVKTLPKKPTSDASSSKIASSSAGIKKPQLVSLVSFFLLFVVSFASTGFVQGLLFLVSILGTVATIRSLRRSVQSPPEREVQYQTTVEKDSESRKSAMEQLRKDWQEKLAALDKVEQLLFQNTSLIQESQRKQEALDQHFMDWKKRRGTPLSLSLENLLETTDPFADLRYAQEEVLKWAEKHNEVEKRLRQWQDSIGLLIDSLNQDYSFAELHQHVRRHFEEMREEEARQQKYVHAIEQNRKEMEKLVTAEHAIVKQKKQLFEAAKVSNETEFRATIKHQKEYRANKTRYDFLVAQYENELALMSAYESIENLQEEAKQVESEIQELGNQIKIWEKKHIQVEASIQKLEEDGKYSELLQQTENMKSEIQFLLNQWAGYKVAASLIEKTLRYAKNDRLPTTIRDTQFYFQELTHGEYTDITVTDDSIMVTHQTGELFHPSELSRGTAEQLYAALRFSFVKNIAENIPLPMVIDDGFVNFDETRKNEMWHLMARVSKKVQILYFTFENLEHTAFQDANTIFL